MRRLAKVSVVLAVALVMASPALAQRQRRGGGGAGGPGMSSSMLLGQKSVQEDLKLSEDQVKKLQEFQTSQREKFRGLRDLSEDERRQKFQELSKEGQKVVDETLQPEQKKRLKQIGLQLQLRMGAQAFSSPEVASALKITDDQKDKLKTIQEEAQKAGREIRESAGDNREEARKKGAELRKQTEEKVMNVLTDDQKAKLKELTGEPFKGQLQFGGPGGGRRGNRNQNNN